MTFPKPYAEPVTFSVAHVDLYFFYDIDVAILVVEVYRGQSAVVPGAERAVPLRPKAALLMLADCLVDAMNNLDVTKRESVRQFQAVIRYTLDVFLRFSHRYWSPQVSDHGQVKELYRMISDHLGTDRLYAELRSELEDMSQYLDSEALRRQGETMVRLTVVATMGLIGVATTGFWGMNLFLVTDEPPVTRFFYFSIVLILAIGLAFYTVLKARRLSDFLETLADEGQSARRKLASLANIWERKLDRERPD